MMTILQVKEIRNKMFHSPDFKLTNTEMKDRIKAMTTLLENSTQLKNDVNMMYTLKIQRGKDECVFRKILLIYLVVNKYCGVFVFI